jgi:hypothetical protein
MMMVSGTPARTAAVNNANNNSERVLYGCSLGRYNNDSPHSRGLSRLLPQLVGSFDPGGGVSGDGNAARVGPINSRSICLSS